MIVRWPLARSGGRTMPCAAGKDVLSRFELAAYTPQSDDDEQSLSREQ